ncbi:type II toxin-antitoxin system RelE/ParE family toxin [Candidatus Woesearchaeota archaeon]|nr:type II toxin-antitoxin system RelE/ParE family toxin [Candidatus Woesearchaeota archaeon]
MFTVEFTEKSLKYLESLDRKDAQRIYKKIMSTKANPLHYIEKLASVDLWKLRVGDYRVIIRLNKSKQVVTVIDIGHRRNVYKKL